MTTSKAELHPAHVWDCDSCGRENFVRAIVAEPDQETAAEFREQTGEDFITGEWLTCPEEVTCAYCGTTYETHDDR